MLRKPADIAALVAKQTELLQALWPLLKPGGLLLYATCSVLPQENWQVLQRFLADHPDAVEKPIPAAWGMPMPLGRQLLPRENGVDGFYYCKLLKLD